MFTLPRWGLSNKQGGSRKKKACDDDAAAPASLTRHLTATHDEWQRLRIGAHHWSSVWHKSRFANHPYPRDAVLEDEGLMDWLGVNRSANCAEASLDGAAAALGARLTRRRHSGYACRPKGARCAKTRAVYVIGVAQGERAAERGTEESRSVKS